MFTDEVVYYLKQWAINKGRVIVQSVLDNMSTAERVTYLLGRIANG